MDNEYTQRRDDARRGKLYHSHLSEKMEDFFKRVDECGGWPVGKKYVSMQHTDARICEFGNDYLNTGWFTTIYSADDYYIWKLSPEAILSVKRKAASELSSYVYSFYGKKQ